MKKNLPLILILAFCGIVFAGGVAVTVSSMLDNGKKEATIEKNKKALDKLLKRKTLALSEENLEQGKASVDALKSAIKVRVGTLLQPKRLETFFKGDATQFMSILTERSRDWSRLCEDHRVELAPATRGFGFSRYLLNNETVPADKLEKMDLGAAVTGELIKALVEARDENEKELRAANVLPAAESTYLKLLSVSREALELAPNQRRTLQRDEIIVEPVADAGMTGLAKLTDFASKELKYGSLRRENAVDAIAFRIDFIGDSGTLRKFVQHLESYPIYIRDIVASRATPDMLPEKNVPATGAPASVATSNPFDLFGSGAAVNVTEVQSAPRVPARRVIVENIPEAFSIVLEYVTPKVQKKEETQKSE